MASTNRTELIWQLGHADTIEETPERWVEATVPGAVQLDIARAENYGPYFFAENWRDYLWMEDKYFRYKTSFNAPELKPGERLYFISHGIDYEFEIRLNGEPVWYQEGMFTPVRLDLTDRLQDENELQVILYPVPKLHESPADRTQAAQSVKPAVSYGWDWHPRLVPSGIWDKTFLEIRNVSHLMDVWVDYTLSESLDYADIEVKVEGVHLDGFRLEWSLLDCSESIVASAEARADGPETSIRSALEKPLLWWPHDHGRPTLYTSVTKLLNPSGEVVEEWKSKVGFRRVRLVMNEGAWSQPQAFPFTRNVAPVQLEINGRRIFAKGTNWVAPEIFPGTIDQARYRELLDRSLEANFNLLRVWGGGIVNKESFFDLCDELGILVWQDFPLACNDYVGAPDYLEVLEQESESIIRRLRKHPSLAIWCGGNELFNSWSRMTDQSLALRLLNSQCLKMDPKTPYINTSPLYGMGHGHYVFRDMENGEEVYARMARARKTAYTEFGMPAPSSVDVLKMIIPEEDLWPPRPGTAWESHHAFNAWQGDTWLMQGMIDDYFGKATNLEQLVANGQLLQCEGYKAIYEEARRQKPFCSMALNWCFNEPWPTAANNSLINWPNSPKPAFYAVRDACRPFLASARIQKFTWREGEVFSSQIWLLNDLPEPVPGGKVIVKLRSGTEGMHLLSWEYDQLEANENLAGPSVRTVLPAWEEDRFELVVEIEGHPDFGSSYTLLYSPGTAAGEEE